MWYIVQRECRDLLRRPRSLWQLGLGLLVFSFLFTTSWHSISRFPDGRSSEMGKGIFMTISFLQLVFLLGLGRIASYSIVGEREKDTWDLLVASPVRPWSIIFGKLVASLLYMGLMYFALLPIIALCFLLGGVSPRELFGTYLILGGAGLLAASVGLACSSTIRSSISAARTTTLLLIFYTVCVPLIRRLFMNVPGQSVEALFSPFHALTTLLILRPAGMTISGASWFVANPEWTFFLSAIGVSTILLMYVASRLRSFESQPPVIIHKKSGKSRSMASKEWSGIPDNANPIWVKEINEQTMRRFFGPPAVNVTLLMFGILIGVLINGITIKPFDLKTIFYTCSTITLLGILFFVPSGPASAISREKDRKTWDLLKTSTCSAYNILLGKSLAELKSSLQAVFFFFLGLYVTLQVDRFAAGYYPYDPEHIRQMGCFLLLAFACVVFYVGVGVYFSSRAKDTAKSHSRTFSVAILHYLGGYLLTLCWLVTHGSRQGIVGRPRLHLSDLLFSLSPMTVLRPLREPSLMEVLMIFHSCFIIVFGISLLFAAWKRIDRYEE